MKRRSCWFMFLGQFFARVAKQKDSKIHRRSPKGHPINARRKKSNIPRPTGTPAQNLELNLCANPKSAPSHLRSTTPFLIPSAPPHPKLSPTATSRPKLNRYVTRAQSSFFLPLSIAHAFSCFCLKVHDSCVPQSRNNTGWVGDVLALRARTFSLCLSFSLSPFSGH